MADPFAAEIAAVNAVVARRGIAVPVLLAFADGAPAYRLAFVRADGTCEFQDPADDVYPGHPAWEPSQNHAAAAVRADLEIPMALDSPFWLRVLHACGVEPHPKRPRPR